MLSILAPIRWEPLEDTSAWLRLTREGSVLWNVYGPGGASEIALPGLPSTVDPGELLGTDPLEAMLYLTDPESAHTNDYRKAVVAAEIEMLP